MFHKKGKNAIPADADEALFAALNKSRKKKRRKIIRTIVIVLVLLAGGAAVGINVLRHRVQTQFASTTQEVLNEAVSRGSISTVVSGSGMLSNVDTETVSVPSGVEVSEILVKYGDAVKVGDLLATVDMASVRTAMSSLQDELDNLDDQISSAKSDKVSSTVTAGVPGRRWQRCPCWPHSRRKVSKRSASYPVPPRNTAWRQRLWAAASCKVRRLKM